MRLLVTTLVAAVGGYLALSHEIVWVRVLSFTNEGRPETFGSLLAAYLSGLAIGSWCAGRICRDPAGDGHLPRVGVVVSLGALAAFLVAPAVAALVADCSLPVTATLPAFALASGVLGLSFPLLCHYGIPADEQAGARLSYVYFANIVGSTLGSLLTGLVLLDVLSLRDLNLVLAAIGIAAGALLMLPARRRAVAIVASIAALGFVIGAAPTLYDDIYEKLLYADEYPRRPSFEAVIEGSGGVVTVTRDGTVYGGGSYEGIANVSPLPEDDENRVLRAYLLAAFHPHPREVLMIGLGSGSWLQVLANHPDIEHITVVELNAGFVEAVRRTPSLASALTRPHVEIIVDDGRRFLARTDRRFDVVVMNTIVYWRAYASLLLSREAMELVRQRLVPGGVLYVNTTMSTAAQKTVATSFDHALRYQNMLIAGDQPIVLDPRRFERKLDAWRIDGRLVLPPTRPAAALDLLREQDWRGGPTWEERAAILARTTNDPMITDDNMATEWWAFETYPPGSP